MAPGDDDVREARAERESREPAESAERERSLLRRSAPTERPLTLELDVRSALGIVVGLLLVAAAMAVVRIGGDMLTKIGIGAVLAVALDPVVSAIRRRFGVPRAAAVVAVGVIVAAIAVFVVLVLGPPAVRQAEDFADELPETVEQMYDFPVVGERLQDADAADKVEEWARDLPARVDDETVTDLANSLFGGALTTAIVVLAMFALLLDGEALVDRARHAVPPARRPQADRIGHVFQQVFGRYFAGSLVVAVIAGLVILSIGLALSVPLTPVAALWMVLVDLIPQVGGFLGGFVFVTLAVTKDLQTGVICLVLYVLYNTFENHVLQPAIVGKSVDLSPPATMMAAIIGGAAAGIPGALVATPLVGTAKVLYFEIRRGRSPLDDAEPPSPARLVARLRRRDRAPASDTDAP
ncbi:MAG TPA: AI-2E family transporter [Acidimicrobiia bacterium]|nr:AI-2E family transporter [Acidimicrobiia bacterium]